MMASGLGCSRGIWLTMPSTLLTVAISAGLALAAAVKVLLTFAWTRLTAPRGKHRGTRLAARLRRRQVPESLTLG